MDLKIGRLRIIHKLLIFFIFCIGLGVWGWQMIREAMATNLYAPMLYAAEKGDVIEVKRYLDMGADPNMECNGITAVDAAKRNHHPAVVQILQQADAKK